MNNKNIKEEKIIPMTYDKMFKSVLTSKEAREYLVDIIAGITGLPKDKVKKDMVFKNTEHQLTSISEKKKISDMVVEVSYGVINLEMNKYYYDGLLDRNHEYISKIRENIIKEGASYEDMKKVIQINFDDYNIYKDKRAILKFEMMDETGLKEGVMIESYHVILPNVKEKYYNENSKDELIGKLVIMVMENSKELQKLIEENMELRPVGKKMVEISRDEELQGIYDGEEHLRKVRNSLVASALKEGWNKGIKEGKEEGIKQGIKEGIEKGMQQGLEQGKREAIIETAKNLLKETIPLEIIMKATGLSKKEILDIKNKIDIH